MMTNFLIYDSTGLILQTGSVPTSMLDLQGSEEADRFVLEGLADLQLDMVQDGAVRPRPAMPAQFSEMQVAADAVDEIVLTGVPAGASVEVIGTVSLIGVADGTDIMLTFSAAGAYLVRLRFFPFMDMEVTISAT